MFLRILNKIFGSDNDRFLKKYIKLLEKVNILEKYLLTLSDDELKNEFFYLKENRGKEEDFIPLICAIVREVSRRKLNMRHFDVQIVGGLALYDSNVTEIATGEGKTLVATIPVCLSYIFNQKVHIITVNEYLAYRDSNWMFPIYNFLGISVGLISQKLSISDKKKAYENDVVYGTCSEFGFDYLRDNIVHTLDDKVQNKLSYAIIDEADSILIDEARTPLIISIPGDSEVNNYFFITKLVPFFIFNLNNMSENDLSIDFKNKNIFLTDNGFCKAEKLLKKNKIIDVNSNICDVKNIEILHILYSCLKAKFLFRIDVDYIIKNGEIFIIDEHTGRILDGRRWGDGLHQAIEAKENLKIKSENQTLASITFQNFFRLYKKLSGMTGTAYTERSEFLEIYFLNVIIIPTNKKVIREDKSDVVFLTKKAKYNHIIDDIITCYTIGQPILVGTISIDVSEFISKMLRVKNIPHNVLNAKFHEKESKIVAEAGRLKSITIATNMAGRGTDIVLGGVNASKIEYLNVVKLGGLRVLGTERHESRRIDNQLRGRSGRQGDPGCTQFYISLEDDLIKIFISDNALSFLSKLKVPQSEVISNSFVNKSIESAQKKVELYNFDVRKQLLEYDNIIDEQRKVFYNYRDNIIFVKDIINIINDSIIDVVSVLISNFSNGRSNIHELCENFFLNFGLDLNKDFLSNLDLTKIHDVNFLKEELINKLKAFYCLKRSNVFDVFNLEKSLFLSIMDFKWKEHLMNLDYLKKGIHLRGYAQKDPKDEYKYEAYLLFKNMLNSIKYEFIVSFLKINFSKDILDKRIYNTSENKIKKNKYGRNELCFCNSGKKYKHCHGK